MIFSIKIIFNIQNNRINWKIILKQLIIIKIIKAIRDLLR